MSPPTEQPDSEPAALRAELARLRLLADNVPVAFAYYEAVGYTCLLANRGYAETFGQSAEGIVGRHVDDIIGLDAARQIRPVVLRVLEQRQPERYEREIPTASGESKHIEVTLLPHIDAAGVAVGAFVLLADITRHRSAEAALRTSEERLAKFMNASAEGIVFHKGGFITDVNPPLLALLGYTLEQMMGRQTLEFVATEERAKVAAVIAAGAEITYDSVAMHQDGHAVPVEFIVRTMQHQDSQQRMTIVRDRRDRVAAEVRFHHLAHHDALTGLPNRLSFDERVRGLIGAARGFALLFIDLDHFKRVNDSLGHVIGDALLQTVARRIAAALRVDDLVARFGGDEFVLVLVGNPPRESVREVAHKLLGVIGESVQVLGSDISVTPSIGVAMFPDDGTTVTELVKNADTAMYAAKRSGRATCHFFERRMAAAAFGELAMEAQLAHAIREQEFELHYQPQVHVERAGDAGLVVRLVGVEALIRWRHPQRGLVEPNEFLPVAEARRQIIDIGAWVMHQALQQAAHWRHIGLLSVPVAVNLSTLQFRAPGFVASVRAALSAASCSGEQLELELTERMLVDDSDDSDSSDAVRATLLRLRALGVRLAIDDFGTGYSSLVHLKSLPIQRLKIDRSFIKDLPGDAGSAAIARAVIQLAISLGLAVVAEGVETEAQRDWCLAQGCHELQGWLTGRAMSVAEFEAWCAAQPLGLLGPLNPLSRHPAG